MGKNLQHLTKKKKVICKHKMETKLYTDFYVISEEYCLNEIQHSLSVL